MLFRSVIDEKAIFQGRCDMNQEESKPRRRPARESRAGKKSAKDALKEALLEVEEESRASEMPDELAAASMEQRDNTRLLREEVLCLTPEKCLKCGISRRSSISHAGKCPILGHFPV